MTIIIGLPTGLKLSDNGYLFGYRSNEDQRSR